MPQGNDRKGCKGTARILMVLIVLTALLGLGLSISTFINRPTTGRLTPAGANYNPGQPGSTTTGGGDRQR